MKVLLHIGSHKTGTSTLQVVFSRSREYLQSRGVLYPYDIHSEPTHASLLTGLYHPDRRPRADPVERPGSNKRREGFIHDLKQAIQEQQPQTVILSSEEFFRTLAEGALEKLQGELTQLGASEIEIITYVRRPSHMYLSSLQQKLKASYQLLPPAFPNYKEVLEPYRRVFGKAQVKVRCFDATLLQDRDIVADFIAHHLSTRGIEPARLTAVGRMNETMSAESMDIVRQHRWDFFKNDDNQFRLSSIRLREQLIALEKSVGLGRPIFKPNIAQSVDYSSSDALWLRDELGIVFPDYDYARVEAGKLIAADVYADVTDLSALVEIDRERQRTLINALQKSRWTNRFVWRDLMRRWRYGLPSHPDWVASLSNRLLDRV